MRKQISALLMVFFLGACSFPGVYRIDVQQGNVVDEEMLEQLQLGMSKRQVLFVMGTPLIRDPFNQARWDYLYRLQPGEGEPRQQQVTLFFDRDTLVKIQGPDA